MRGAPVMACDRLDILLFLHVHGETSFVQRMRIRMHVRRCPQCSLREELLREERAGLARSITVSVLDESEEVRVREAIATRIGGGRPMAQRESRARPHRSKRAAVFATVAFALLLTLGLLALRRTAPGANCER